MVQQWQVGSSFFRKMYKPKAGGDHTKENKYIKWVTRKKMELFYKSKSPFK